jgi:hypothetical protein
MFAPTAQCRRPGRCEAHRSRIRAARGPETKHRSSMIASARIAPRVVEEKPHASTGPQLLSASPPTVLPRSVIRAD